jgi:aconitate hydratase
MASLDSFSCLSTLDVGEKTYHYFDLNKAMKNGLADISRLPFSLKVLLENLLRMEDGSIVRKQDIEALAKWLSSGTSTHEIAYYPARVLMQDFTGVPAVVDLAAMRDAMVVLGGDPKKINPLRPVDLVIDHSVMVDVSGSADAFQKNEDIEFERNSERYTLLKWAQSAFDNFRAVPPGTGICHQVNLENLAQVVWSSNEDGRTYAYPDTCVGTDSHTTMINGLAVLGWGVGGIEAEAAMLAQPVSMVIPDVIGFKLTGKLKEGVTATDLVLVVVEMLRKKGVVGKFVEFYGEGLNHMMLADRATIANMAPEYGATCGFFPIDDETLNYMRFTGRVDETVELVEKYAKAQGMWRTLDSEPKFSDMLSLDMSTVQPCLAGPKRPQDRIILGEVGSSFEMHLGESYKVTEPNKSFAVASKDFELNHGAVAIAAITSCTNTSNPSVMIAAGLVAKNAAALGLKTKPWVKTSLAPGSQVVSDYLAMSGLQTELDKLGFHLVGYGCTTCIGNSGPLMPEISESIHKNGVVVASVLSGNRNFEGRISPDVKANYLASPPLVVAYALAGTVRINLDKDPLGKDKSGKDVYLKDIWPTNEEIKKTLEKSLTPKMFRDRYLDVFKGSKHWQKIPLIEGFNYAWDEKSTYIKNPPYFEGMTKEVGPQAEKIKDARILAVFADSVTTDHISPAGSIKKDSPAGVYLSERGIAVADFNSYGSRRGNHEVMMRGTFANIRIRNEMLQNVEGGYTVHIPSGKQMSIYDAAMAYQKAKTPLVVFAGKEYGTGSSRDWAAKGTQLLGVKAVIAESFERIHRSNLIGMGVLPLQFKAGSSRQSLNITGMEMISLDGEIKPRATLKLFVQRENGATDSMDVDLRIDTDDELSYFKNGGILPYVLRRLA